MLRVAPLLLAALLAQAACAARQKWEGGPILENPELIAQEFSPLLLDAAPPLETPDIPMPSGLRPCCAFGARLQVELGPLPVPMLVLTNVIGVEDLGPHQYDHGVFTFRETRPGSDLLTSERNGLVYTCRGGFIDTAHMREWADWTLYLSALIARTIESGTTIALRDEGGQRRIVTHPVDPQRVALYGALPLAVPLAQWLAFQLSVWHEIATWYGWSATAFSEEASAFSPEDLYSNLLGIKTAAILIYESNVTSQAAYNENMNVAIPRLLQRLGAVPGEVGRVAMGSVDGIWWDSRARLPEKRLVRRRYLGEGTQLSPWLVSRAWRSGEADRTVGETCARKEQPIVLQNPDDFAEVPFRAQATLEITMSGSVAARMARESRRDRITQDDFPAIVAQIRAENGREFGAAANGPDAQ